MIYTGVRMTAAALLVIGLLFLACAEIGAPPGGPEDKTGPAILATTPENNAINVAPGDRIAIQFSESINKNTIENAVFISPRLDESPKYKWDGKRLNIILPDSFAREATCVVTIGSTVSDLRNNKMDSSFTIAFSTGEQINRGRISGLVMQENEPRANVTVGLFAFAAPDSSTIFDSLYPRYLTQSGSDGSYRLDYLPDGDYFPLAFMDKNKNQRFNIDRDAYGLTDRPIAVSGQGILENINFNMTKYDTTTISIISVTPTVDRLIKVKFSGKVIPDELISSLDRIWLMANDTSRPRLTPICLKEQGKDPVSSVHLWFASLPDGTYTLEIDNDLLNAENDSMDVMVSPVFTVKTEPDQTPPIIERVSHDKNTVFNYDSVISVGFSEPIDKNLAGDSLVRIFSDSANAYPLSYRYPNPLTLDVYVHDLLSGTTNLILVDQKLLADGHGNVSGDSIVQFQFKTFDDDSLGYISGTVSFAPGMDSSGMAHLLFANTDLKRDFERMIPSQSFTFSLPPGKYLLRGYLDRNENGSPDAGSLLPLTYSETWMTYPDTIRVRSRFETAGIEFQFK